MNPRKTVGPATLTRQPSSPTPQEMLKKFYITTMQPKQYCRCLLLYHAQSNSFAIEFRVETVISILSFWIRIIYLIPSIHGQHSIIFVICLRLCLPLSHAAHTNKAVFSDSMPLHLVSVLSRIPFLQGQFLWQESNSTLNTGGRSTSGVKPGTDVALS